MVKPVAKTSPKNSPKNIDAVFDEKYSKLNQKQKEAVDTIEGPVMVIAGPGTGKTSILTLRIANILKRTDTPPGAILAITFTEAGVKAIRMKLRDIIGSRADEVRIHTFHGFASAVIAELDEHFPHLSRSKQITDIEAQGLIRAIIRDKKLAKLRPVGEPEFYVDKIVRSIGEAKKEAWTPDMISQFATEEIERVKNDEESISSRGATKGQLKADAVKRIEKCERTILFAEVYRAYELKKREDKKIDFDDLIIELLVAMKKDELLLRTLQEKFLYILVDEHQDTNDSQNLLIRTLADFFENPNLFVVGDEKQAIYRFQGASVENFLQFQNVWQSMKVISLDSNYRSHQSILDSGFSLIENNYEDGQYENLRVKLISGSKEKQKPIDVVMAGNVLAGEEYLVKEIKGILSGTPSGTPEKTIALITRTNRDVEKLISVMEKAGIPAIAERGTDIFSHPMGILFFELIKFLADPSEIEALAHTVAGGLWNLSFSESAGLVRSIRSGNVSGVDKSIPVLAKLRAEIARSGAIEFLVNAGDLSGFSDLASKNPLSVEVWRGIVTLAAEIARRDSIEDPRKLISELLSYQTSSDGKSVKVQAGASDAMVRIMTAHGSKGLEYDYVFIPYANEESWIMKTRATYFVMPREKGDADDLRDTRRLFYVALTRARSHVCIISPLSDDTGRELLPLRFIQEFNISHIARSDVKASANAITAKSAIPMEVRRRNELVEFAKHVIGEKGLSVTALNHFCECPSLFFYKSILKLPEAPAASSEKGNAMHEAIALVWHQENKNEKAITETLQDSIKSYFDKSLLPKFEKDVVLAELLENSPVVAKALVSHFALTGNVSTEGWFETTFKSEVKDSAKGNPISINLHGKLDAVVDQDSKVLVFDYKTRGGMSPAAIKGETKSSEAQHGGNYFRQLVFYRILLESNAKFRSKSIEPALVFVKPDDKGRCPTVALEITSADIEKVKSEIQTLIDSVWSGKLIDDICEDPKCTWCRLKAN